MSQGTLEGMCGATTLNQLACGEDRGTGMQDGRNQELKNEKTEEAKDAEQRKGGAVENLWEVL